MSEERTIKVDPLSLKIPDNKTRKKKEKIQNPIRIKSSKPEKKPKASTLKRNLLNMIRSNQEKRLKKQPKSKIVEEEPTIPPKTDFEESVQFLSSLPKKQNTHHRTLRNYTPPIENNIQSIIPTLPPPPPPINAVPIQIEPMSNHTTVVPIKPAQPPPYGNLKNGSKPTYRTWKNQTQRVLPSYAKPIIPPKEVSPSPIQINYEAKLRDQIKTMSEREQFQQMKNKKPHVKKPKKQKRTVRRTYRTGKSKVHPRVSVLVSNKTLRSQANTNKLKLKETPMPEVKQFLRKNGFIKVGTNTPNDVLRQMYENVKMICGEVHNHNPENLLYNYFNDIEEPSFV